MTSCLALTWPSLSLARPCLIRDVKGGGDTTRLQAHSDELKRCKIHHISICLLGFRSQAAAAGDMSSPPKEKADTRAGHLPAVKAGGMRIVQKHPHATEVKEEREKDEEDWETGASPPKPTLFISGAVARGDKDFPPAAAQVAHQKPHASVEKLPPPQQFNQHIHQPRK